jgi:hypothetical protein
MADVPQHLPGIPARSSGDRHPAESVEEIMTKKRRRNFIQRATLAEHLITLAIWKQEKQLQSAQGKWVWIKTDRMMGQLVYGAAIRVKLQAQLKMKRQMLQFLREGKITQP